MKQLIQKLDPTEIFKIATSVVETKRDLDIMKIKATAFVRAIEEHEITSRLALKEQTEMFKIMVEALQLTIQNSESKEERMKALEILVGYGTKALTQLGKTSKNILQSIPNQPRIQE